MQRLWIKIIPHTNVVFGLKNFRVRFSIRSKSSDYLNVSRFLALNKRSFTYYVHTASCLFARVCTTYDAMQLGKISTKSSSDANANPESTNPDLFFTKMNVVIYIYSTQE